MADSAVYDEFQGEQLPQVEVGATGRMPVVNLGRREKKAPSKEAAAHVSMGSVPMGKRLYTLREAARYLGRSDWGMRDLIWAGKIPVVREEGGRKIFIDVHDLVAYVERNKAVYN
jgi:excisionase family DNA binding protein